MQGVGHEERQRNNLVGEEIVVLEVEGESKPGVIQVQGDRYVGQVLQHDLVVLLDQPHQGLLVAVLEHVQPELWNALRVLGEVRVETKLLHLLGEYNLLKDQVARSTNLDLHHLHTSPSSSSSSLSLGYSTSAPLGS